MQSDVNISLSYLSPKAYNLNKPTVHHAVNRETRSNDTLSIKWPPSLEIKSEYEVSAVRRHRLLGLFLFKHNDV